MMKTSLIWNTITCSAVVDAIGYRFKLLRMCIIIAVELVTYS